MADEKENEAKEEQAAELLAFALGARPERITDALLAPHPPEVRTAVTAIQQTLATLALADKPEKPSPEVRERLLKTITEKRRTPRAALVIVDMVNDHLRPGSTLEVPRARAIVPALQQRIANARTAGMPIVYVVDRHTDDDSDMDFVDGWGAHNIEGTDGDAVWPDLAPESTDRIVHKPTYSAFTESNLEEVLEELKVDSLVLTGCLTELGLMATATAALERGFAVEVPVDSQAGSHPDIEKNTLITLSAMVPYGPARKARLAKLALVA